MCRRGRRGAVKLWQTARGVALIGTRADSCFEASRLLALLLQLLPLLPLILLLLVLHLLLLLLRLRLLLLLLLLLFFFLLVFLLLLLLLLLLLRRRRRRLLPLLPLLPLPLRLLRLRRRRRQRRLRLMQLRLLLQLGRSITQAANSMAAARAVAMRNSLFLMLWPHFSPRVRVPKILLMIQILHYLKGPKLWEL